MGRLPTPGGGCSTTVRGRTKEGLEVEPEKSKIFQTDLETVLELPRQANRTERQRASNLKSVSGLPMPGGHRPTTARVRTNAAMAAPS